jgi:fructose-bisphosphate aldolase class II
VAARGICKERFEAFGSAGQAAKIAPLPLETMAQRYASRPRPVLGAKAA